MSEQGKYQYDIFISYSHRDRVWVKDELMPRLENAGLKVCIDYRDFKYGLASQINMEEAAKNSRHTIAVLTQKWVDSDWSQFEALTATLKDPVGRQQRLIPLLREDCSIPDRIQLRTYADFRSLSEQTWQYLLGQLRPQGNAAAQAPTPQPVILPSQNPFSVDSSQLIGREQEIQRIQEKLRAGNHCSVVGPHGSGKSFVLKYVREQLPVWCGWQEQEILSFDFRLIYTLKELHKEFVVQLGGQEAYEWRSLLRSKPPRLLVLDNLGGMNPGELGLKMRRWLRGIGDEGVKLLPISNEKLDVLFRKDDPNRDSPLANIDPLPVQLAPLSIDACRTIVQQRLSGIALDTDQFAEALRIPRQPKELLILCAARYEELRKGTK